MLLGATGPFGPLAPLPVGLGFDNEAVTVRLMAGFVQERKLKLKPVTLLHAVPNGQPGEAVVNLVDLEYNVEFKNAALMVVVEEELTIMGKRQVPPR